MISRQFRFVWLLGLLAPTFALPASRYFEGELLIEQSSDQEGCQRIVGTTKSVQISWQEGRKGRNSHISGWIVFAGGAPGKIEGPRPAQMTVTTNYYDAHLNTPMTLALDVVDGHASGTLRETPASLGVGESMCYWQKAKLTLTEKTGDTDVERKMREHAAWYKAFASESRGDFLARYNQFAEAAAAHDQAIAEVDGVLPETRSYFKGLLNYTALLYSKAKDYERAAQRYQRFMDISMRQSDIGVDDPDFYRGWIRLATYMYLAKRTNEAITTIERAARLEARAKDVSLDDRLLRLRLQGNIYIAAQMFDVAQARIQDEVSLATAEAGANDLRTFEAKVQSSRALLAMKYNARFEAAFGPLVKEITTRFGEASPLARDSNGLLGMHYYRTDAIVKARPWLESAFRGHMTLVDSAAQAVREDEEARSILASLLDIYIRQGIAPKDFLDRVRAGEASLDDLPFREPLVGNLSLPAPRINPSEWEKLLKH